MAKKNKGSFLESIAKALGINVSAIKKNSKKALVEENKRLKEEKDALEQENAELQQQNNDLKLGKSVESSDKENNASDFSKMLDDNGMIEYEDGSRIVKLEDGAIAFYDNEHSDPIAVADDEMDIRNTEYYYRAMHMITNYFAKSNVSLQDFKELVANKLRNSAAELATQMADNTLYAMDKTFDLRSSLNQKIKDANEAIKEKGLNEEEYKCVLDLLTNRTEAEIKQLKKETEKENARLQKEVDDCYLMADITEDELLQILTLFGIKTYAKSYIKFINKIKAELREEGDRKEFLKYSFKDTMVTDEEMKSYLYGMINNEYVEYQIDEDFQNRYDLKLKKFRYYVDLANKCYEIGNLINDDELRKFALETYNTNFPLTKVTVREVKENLIRRALLRRLKETYKAAQETREHVSELLRDKGKVSEFVAKLSSRTIYNGSKIEGKNIALQFLTDSNLESNVEDDEVRTNDEFVTVDTTAADTTADD